MAMKGQWMEHPDHGRVRVTDRKLMDHNLKNGWVKCEELKVEDLPNYVPDDEKPGPRSEMVETLRELADAMGVEYDGRWGVDRLKAAIAEHGDAEAA